MSIISQVKDFLAVRPAPAPTPAPIAEQSIPVRRNPTRRLTKSSFTDPSSSLMFSTGAWPSNTGVPTSPLASFQIAAVYACISAIANDLSKLPILVQQRVGTGGWKTIPNHPVSKLLKEPNNYQTTADLVSHLAVGTCLFGNGYAYVQRDDDNGDPIGIIPIIPERCQIMIDPEFGFISYDFSSPHIPNEQLWARSYDMIHIKNISVDGAIRGLSPIAMNQDVLGIGAALQRHVAQMFRQGTMQSGILKHKGTMSPEAKMRLQQSFTSAFSGSDNAHKVIVLEEETDYQAAQFNPKDTQLLESRQFQVVEICRMYGVPPHRIAHLLNATFSNIEQQQLHYIGQSLQTLATKIERQMEKVLFFDEERDDLRIWIDFNQMTRNDEKTRMESYAIALQNGILSINEVREREGYGSIGPEGDEHSKPSDLKPNAKPTVNTDEKPVGSSKPDESESEEE
jgi:HK97 family phage portal protein